LIAFENIFQEIAVLLLVASAVSALLLWLRQPLIVAYILVGIVAGPSVFGLITSYDEVDLLAQMGIAVLLFVVGLKLDLHLIRTMGPVALATGLGQVVFTSVIGYFLSLALGLSPVTAVYVAVALTFSSTIIIVKLLSDKREIDSLHGKIAVGFLIVQDIVVVLVMIGLTAFGSPDSSESFSSTLLFLLLKGSAFILTIGLLMRDGLPALLRHLSRSRELLVLFSISWAVFLAVISAALGFSKEIGAFVAGISLASTEYREAIGSRLVNLRDFLFLFFFLDLGAKLDIQQLGVQVGPAVILSLFVLIGNPIIVMIIMGSMGYRKRTGFLAGLTVAQISEFSLILAALGVSLGHIDTDALGLITLVGLITIGLSTYMILYSHPFYNRLAPWLRIFERSVPRREDTEGGSDKGMPVDVILFGVGRYGSNLARNLTERGERVLGVDFDSETVGLRNKQGLKVCYGDAEDPECPSTLPVGQSKWVVSTIPQLDINLALLDALKHYTYQGRKAFVAHSDQDAAIIREAGADMILSPFVDAAREAAGRIAEAKNREADRHTDEKASA
jgi:Kef-type K+ transport system membrane component KefB